MKLETGKTYLVSHSRKGTFTMRVDYQDDTWARGVIVDGKAAALLGYNERYSSEEVSVRLSHIRKATEHPGEEKT